MNADAFRYLYDYHFAENHKLWHYATMLTPEQFTQPLNYSHGSVRDQIVHLLKVDDAWFGGLRGNNFPEPADPINPDNLPDRQTIRTYGDQVEQRVRQYLTTLRDDMLFTKPLGDEDEELYLWQILLHVANHGTDHRAQTLRLLNDLGIETTYQDLVFYIYGHPID